MSQRDLSGFDGAVTLPGTIGGQAKGFTVRRQMINKIVTRFGDGRGQRRRGGVIDIGGELNLFVRMGSGSATPNFVNPAANGETASLTLTLEVGCALTGPAIFPDLNINEQFADPAIEGTHSYFFQGLPSEMWATTG